MRVSLIAGALLVASWTATAQADSHCSIPGVAFASCTPKARHFQSVVVAIPGWNGDCKETFGEGADNLLNVMRQRNFFDIDCFDYDSNHTMLAKSRDLLRNRLEALHAAGYREFAFVTHSTGGVLALDLLLAEALNAGALRGGSAQSFMFRNDGGARLRALYTWAVPLNGVRDQITLGGSLINLVEASPAVLPMLEADSDYLRALKDRLREFDSRFGVATAHEKASYGFEWIILQGQNDDWVVRNVARSEPWFPAAVACKIVNTESSHSHNVAVAGDKGTVGSARFPGEMMGDKSLLALGLYPRTKEYFARGVSPSSELARQQRVVLGGILDYASNRNLFTNAYAAVSDFVVLMLKGEFPRDPRFDEEVVAGFSKLLETKISELDHEYAVDFADRLLDDIENGLSVETIGQPTRFGAGSYRAVRRLADVVSSVFKSVTLFVRNAPSLERKLRSSRSLQNFQARVARVLDRFLNVADDETQARAVLALRSVAADAVLPALTEARVVAHLGEYSRRTYRGLGEKQRTELAEVFAALGQRSAAISSETFMVLNQPVTLAEGQKRPLWDALFAKNDIDTIVTTMAAGSLASKGQIDFLGSVIGSDGSGGKSPDSAIKAIGIYERYLSTAMDAVAADDAAALRNAARKSQYPVVIKGAERVLRAPRFEQVR